MTAEPADAPVATETTATAVERSFHGARLRTLVVGAGIAGATFAALQRQRGEPVALLERNPASADDNGYMLGLLPLGGRVLNGLGLADRGAAASLDMRHYDLYDRRGRLIRRFPLHQIVERFGSWQGIERGVLLGLLRSACGPITYDATVTGLERSGETVVVTFDDGSTTRCDLVVAADGLHSPTRDLLLDPDETEDFDTGWAGFVVWATPDGQERDTYSELWSDGWGIGLYPVPGRVGIFLAGRHRELVNRSASDHADALAATVPAGPFATALSSLDRSSPGFLWKMADHRATVWSRDRAVLLGDAAAGFLPTAGVGASAAMDSAAALADELSRADIPHLDHALALYERRQRPRVERAQKNSRTLARTMFVHGGAKTFARDQLARLYSLDRLVSDISGVMEGR